MNEDNAHHSPFPISLRRELVTPREEKDDVVEFKKRYLIGSSHIHVSNESGYIKILDPSYIPRRNDVVIASRNLLLRYHRHRGSNWSNEENLQPFFTLNEFFNNVIQLSLPTYLNVLAQHKQQQQPQQLMMSTTSLSTQELASDLQLKKDIIVNSIISIVTSSGGYFVRPIKRSKVVGSDISLGSDREQEEVEEGDHSDDSVLHDHPSKSNQQHDQHWSYASHHMMKLFTSHHLKRAASACYRKGILRAVNHPRQTTTSSSSCSDDRKHHRITEAKRQSHYHQYTRRDCQQEEEDDEKERQVTSSPWDSSNTTKRSRLSGNHDEDFDHHEAANHHPYRPPRLIRKISIHEPNPTFSHKFDGVDSDHSHNDDDDDERGHDDGDHDDDNDDDNHDINHHLNASIVPPDEITFDSKQSHMLETTKPMEASIGRQCDSVRKCHAFF